MRMDPSSRQPPAREVELSGGGIGGIIKPVVDVDSSRSSRSGNASYTYLSLDRRIDSRE